MVKIIRVVAVTNPTPRTFSKIFDAAQQPRPVLRVGPADSRFNSLAGWFEIVLDGPVTDSPPMLYPFAYGVAEVIAHVNPR